MVFNDEGVYVVFVSCSFSVGFGACSVPIVSGPGPLQFVLYGEVARDGDVYFEFIPFQGKDQVDPAVCVPW